MQNLNPSYTTEDIIRLLYPYKTMLKDEARRRVEEFLNDFGVRDKESRKPANVTVKSVDRLLIDADQNDQNNNGAKQKWAEAQIGWGRRTLNLQVGVIKIRKQQFRLGLTLVVAKITLLQPPKCQCHRIFLQVSCGSQPLESAKVDENCKNDSYVSNSAHDRMLSAMLVSHGVGDFCLIGPKGCGKTTLLHKFAGMLGYDTATIMLYQVLISFSSLCF